MRIYFEDRHLVFGQNVPDFDFIVDARCGYSQNKLILDSMLSRSDENYAVYTNSLVALDNRYCWNRELGVPELYLRSGENNKFTRVDELTDRELIAGHNLLSLFRNGEFRKSNCPKNS